MYLSVAVQLEEWHYQPEKQYLCPYLMIFVNQVTLNVPKKKTPLDHQPYILASICCRGRHSDRLYRRRERPASSLRHHQRRRCRQSPSSGLFGIHQRQRFTHQERGENKYGRIIHSVLEWLGLV